MVPAVTNGIDALERYTKPRRAVKCGGLSAGAQTEGPSLGSRHLAKPPGLGKILDSGQ